MARNFYKTLTGLADKLLPQSVSGSLRAMVRAQRDNRNRIERARREAFWEKNKGGDRTIIIEVQPGVCLILYFDSDLCRLIYRGQYETEERHFLNAFLREGDLVIDAGANIGLFTVIASKIVGDKGRVHAFEPCAKTFQRLTANIELNKSRNVAAHQEALSDKPGEIEMTISLDGYDAWNSIALNAAGGAKAVEKVKTVAWDDIAETICAGAPVAVMKVDIEGWESHFIAGARRFLSRDDAPLLLMEFNDELARAAGSSGKEVYLQLEKLGYRLYNYDMFTRQLSHDPVRDSYRYVNLVAVKKIDAVQSRLQKGSVPDGIY